jgi:hypothetical protein
METGLKLTTRQGIPGYRVTLRRKTPEGVKVLDKFFSFLNYGGKAKALAEANKASKEFTEKYPVDRSLFKSSKEKLLGRSDYKTSELNKATKYLTKNKFKTYESLLKKAYKGKTQDQLLKSADPLYMKVIGVKSLLRKNKGKFKLPDPTGGQFEAFYFTDYTNKDFIKDLKNKKGPYQIASEYYVDNPWIEKNLRKTGNKEYTRPIGYLAKVLTARRKKDDTVDAAIRKYRAWEDKQKVPRTEYEYRKKIKALLPLAIENGIIPPEVNTNDKYFRYVNKNRIDPLMRLFNNLEKIGVEHIGGISRAVDLSDYRTLGEIVPILGGKKVNSEKGILFDRPMTGLAKTAATAPVKEARERNLSALNKMAIAAKADTGIPVSLYEFADKRSSKGLQRVSSDRTLLDPLLEDAKLLIKKQVVPQGGSKRKFFKDYPVNTQNAIKAVEAGDNAGFLKYLKAGLTDAVRKSPTSCKAFLNKAVGGPLLDCIDTINKDPIKAAQQLSETKATSAAVGKVKNIAKGFLNILGKGKTFAVTAGVGAGAGALVKAFRNDDPTTYLTNDKQANAMILDTADQLEREERQAAVGDAPELLDEANIAANLGVTAAAIPGSKKVFDARKAKGFGAVRAGLGPVGKALSGFATPLGIAAITPLNVASQVYQGDSAEEILTDPLNYLGPAFAGSLTREATRGMSPTSNLSKALRLGMNPATIRTASRFFGLPGLALSLGYEGYDQYKKYTEGRGFVYNLLNKDE